MTVQEMRERISEATPQQSSRKCGEIQMCVRRAADDPVSGQKKSCGYL